MNKNRGTRVFKARLDQSGRITMPAEIRSELGISVGDEVLIIRNELGLHVETPEQASLAMRSYFKSLVPNGTSLTDELIAERRAEAERD